MDGDQFPSSTTPAAATANSSVDASVAAGHDAFGALVQQVSAVVLGDPTPIRLAAAAFAASGHVLFEDIPGVGKTLLAKAMAGAIGGTFGRVQGTPDLLPSDLTGITYLNEQTREWVFRPGPLFNNVVLVDELNRATPRTQSALLEAMAEGHVTVDGTTHELPDPFLVIATQNPKGGDPGTFPLVGGQRDRFSVSLSLGLPGRQAELAIIAGQGGDRALTQVHAGTSLATWQDLRRDLEDVFVHDSVAGYALDIIDQVRATTGSLQPLSTRAALAMIRLGRAHAVAQGRDYVRPDDIQAITVAALSHRIVDATNDDLPTARNWVGQILARVPVPPAPSGS